MSKTLLGFGLLLAGASGLFGCGGDGGVAGLFSSLTSGSDPLPFAWPPQVGERFPELELRDPAGNRVELASFAGKVLLIEPIGMT